MVLKFSGQFNRDIAIRNEKVLNEIVKTIANIKNAPSIEYIQHLKKLTDYKTLYRIRVADEYRIGLMIRGNTVWFSRFGHRNVFYRKLFP